MTPREAFQERDKAGPIRPRVAVSTETLDPVSTKNDAE